MQVRCTRRSQLRVSDWEVVGKSLQQGTSVTYYKRTDDFYDCTLQGSVEFTSLMGPHDGASGSVRTGDRDLGHANDWNKMAVTWKNHRPTSGLCASNPYLNYNLAMDCKNSKNVDDYLEEKIYNKGYEVPEITLYKCKDINEFTGGSTEGVEVWLRLKTNRGRCATVDTFGVNE